MDHGLHRLRLQPHVSQGELFQILCSRNNFVHQGHVQFAVRREVLEVKPFKTSLGFNFVEYHVQNFVEDDGGAFVRGWAKSIVLIGLPFSL